MTKVERLSVPLLPPVAAAVAALHAACFDRSWPADEIATLAAMPGAFGALASEDGVPVGFVLGRRATDEAEIVTIGVHPARRRRGVGQALLTHTAHLLARQGVVSLFIEVAATNNGAKALYRDTGFEEVGRRPGYYQDSGEDALIMRCALSPPDLNAMDA